MNQIDFIKALAEEHDACTEISRAKNTDYAKEKDAFANFRGAEMFGITVEQGILVRMSDKMMRISNLIQQEAQVKDESIGDTLSDLANYALILKVYIENK